MLPRDPFQIRLSGTGGQGLILAGVVLSDAAIHVGLEVVQTQSYGPEARLGASRSELIISTQEIAYPQVTEPDLLLCLSQEAYRKFGSQITSETTVIMDERCMKHENLEEAEMNEYLHILPIIDTAIQVKSKVVANVVALGAIQSILHLVSFEALERSVLARVPKGFREINAEALSAGHSLLNQTDQIRQTISP